jgi:sugar transferase (PEP-CTERM system associated)
MLFETHLTTLCGVASLYIRFGPEAAVVFFERQGWMKILLVTAVVQACFYMFDLYDLRLVKNRLMLCIRLLQATGLASIVLAFVFYALPDFTLGRGVFLLSLILMLTLMACWRLLAIWLLGHPKLAERVLILGTEQPAIELAREILDRRAYGYEVVGFVGNDPRQVGRSLINPCVVGVTADIEQVVREYRPDRIVVALADRRGQLPIDPLLRMKLRDDVVIEEMASFYEKLTGRISTEMLRPSWLIFSENSRRMRVYRRVRVLLDVTLSLVGLILSLPVMALTAIAIKLDSVGPVFYVQERVGLHNRRFRIIKFRSMRTDAEAGGPVWAGEADPRVTRVGRVIRKLRIDELPQFINVIRGEMTFIGPRPERPEFVEWLEQVIPYYSQRNLVKPGLTGWAQVSYPYGASVEDAMQKLQFDLYYIKNQSPVLDAIIIFETVRIVLFGRGAR